MPKPKKSDGLFKTRKSREPEAQGSDTLTPPKAVAEAIDLFREAQEQAKHYEAEATIHKDEIVNYSQHEYSKRLIKGKGGSFKLMGDQSMVTYVVMDSSAGLTDEDLESFKERWGDDAADELIVRDFASIRFDGEVLEANYDVIAKALNTLPKDIRENLFKPMLMKAKPGAAETAKQYAKTAEDLAEILQHLKIKNYIR